VHAAKGTGLNKMDQTAKLIRWQRITIAVLLLAVILLGFCTHTLLGQQDHFRTRNRMLADLYQRCAQNKGVPFCIENFYTEDSAGIALLHRYEKTIAEQNQRLKQYEARCGEIESARDAANKR
jgi:hypothetical protein